MTERTSSTRFWGLRTWAAHASLVEVPWSRYLAMVCLLARPHGAANPTLLLLRLGLGGLLDLVQHDLTVATEPRRHRHKLRPLGLVEPHPAAPFVILRGQREWRQQTA